MAENVSTCGARATQHVGYSGILAHVSHLGCAVFGHKMLPAVSVAAPHQNRRQPWARAMSKLGCAVRICASSSSADRLTLIPICSEHCPHKCRRVAWTWARPARHRFTKLNNGATPPRHNSACGRWLTTQFRILQKTCHLFATAPILILSLWPPNQPTPPH